MKNNKHLAFFMVFKTKQKKENQITNLKEIWVQTRVYNEVFYKKMFAKKL